MFKNILTINFFSVMFLSFGCSLSAADALSYSCNFADSFSYRHDFPTSYQVKVVRTTAASAEPVLELLGDATNSGTLYPDEVKIVDVASGEVITLADLGSKKVVIFLWAPWCIESIEALKELDKLALELKRSGASDVSVLPIMLDFANPSDAGVGNLSKAIEDVYRANGIKYLGRFFEKEGNVSLYFGSKNPPLLLIWYGDKRLATIDVADLSSSLRSSIISGEIFNFLE